MHEFTQRLRKRSCKPGMETKIEEKEESFEKVLKEAQESPCPDWTSEELDKVLKSLKKDQARDPDGLINEIFTYDNIGKDLKQSLLILCNKIRNEKHYPEFLAKANISAIYKGKNTKSNLENFRGIFLLSKITYNTYEIGSQFEL